MAWIDRLSKLLPNQRLDVRTRFELLRDAVSGTMSKFYMARDRKTGQIVGLKILDRQKTAFLESRFKGLNKPTEGAIAIQFDHPRIVRTYEHGLTTEGAQYLEMEYLDGVLLNAMLASRDGRLEGRRANLIRQAAEAVDAVHKAGFIHRDVCPRNMMIVGPSGGLKLIDFGLAVPATPPFMQPGNRTGTPNYMAPELVRRRATDQRLDVFSFGVSAYEVLTFELPWARGTTGMAAMTHDQPPADIRQYRPQIHPTLAKAVHWCVEPDLSRRCPSMEQFLLAIRRVEHEDKNGSP